MTTPAARIAAGDVRAAARLMRDLDDRRPGAIETLRALAPHTGRAFVVGITGSPGAGKSTLVDELIARLRARGERVGVVAVDPSSPLTGGAILGDRVRMQRHATDEGVFIRSLATRGALGGLSRAAGDVVTVLDAMGYDVVLLETVGVGQDEVDVVAASDLTLVVVPPGLGDGVQAIKAGLLEVADVLVVNKADREGADAVVRDLETMLALREAGPKDVPILRTSATKGEGVDELVATIDERRRAPERAEERAARRLRRRAARLRTLVEDAVRARAEVLIAARGGLAALAADPRDPYQIAADLVGVTTPRV